MAFFFKFFKKSFHFVLGQRSLGGCSPWGRQELDTTEWLHFHLSLSCTGEGNGNPFQCSCLENPRDGGAWWAAVYGVAQSRTRLKQLSSSSSSTRLEMRDTEFGVYLYDKLSHWSLARLSFKFLIFKCWRRARDGWWIIIIHVKVLWQFNYYFKVLGDP